MIIECNHCEAKLDISGVPKSDKPITIKCTQCGHLITDIRIDSDQPRSTDELFSADWQVRKVDGEILSFAAYRLCGLGSLEVGFSPKMRFLPMAFTGNLFQHFSVMLP